MIHSNQFSRRRTSVLMAAAFLLITSAAGNSLKSADAAAGASSDGKAYIATAANGEKIPYPTSTATYTVKDGAKTIQVPEGMVYIPAGSFVMGTMGTGDLTPVMTGTANPVHTVELSAYCIAKYMVTNAEYKVFCDEMGSDYRSGMWPADEAELDAFLAEKANHPVLGVSWANAMAYCDWISSKTGWKITLPSEAQWERAARGATTDWTQYTYPWGNTVSLDDYRTHLNYIMNVAVKYGQPEKEVTYGNTKYDVYWPFAVDRETGRVINQMEFGHKLDNEATTDIVENSPEARAVWDKVQAARGCTTPVGSFSPSPTGCYDMAGNAFQWTRDWFTISYYIKLAEQMTDPVVEDEAILTDEDIQGSVAWARGTPTKVIRGGSWYAHKESAQCPYRSSGKPGGGISYVQGFRVLMLNP